jgi:hypothetical protein
MNGSQARLNLFTVELLIKPARFLRWIPSSLRRSLSPLALSASRCAIGSKLSSLANFVALKGDACARLKAGINKFAKG